VDERTPDRTAAELARITDRRPGRIAEQGRSVIVEQFSFHQASVFMLDDRGRFAMLQASYGPAAREMLARGHRLEVGSSSIIGWVTANRQPRVASDVAEDPIHLRNELLPQTRSEVGVPIAVGNLVLGALDVQSVLPNAFGRSDRHAT
jgi:GAF domain-containing protein